MPLTRRSVLVFQPIVQPVPDGKNVQTVQKTLRKDFVPEEETDKQAVVAATTDRVKIEP